ncbi:MAG: release factor glutamine methyltransferase [Saprospiraceae bacterium]|jgi:release factor glutamine methyltransferase
MSIEQTYLRVLKELSKVYDSREAAQVAEILFEDKFGITNWKKKGTWEEEHLLEEALDRIKSGEPIQYVTEIAHFYGRKFKVNKNVLIPRPETEELVFNVLNQVKSNHRQYDVLDIGTGSGCIPITLKKEKAALRLFAMDYCQDVINLAKINARNLKAQIGFYKFDFLDNSFWAQMGCFDIIISNPPYIAEQERVLMTDSVLKFEPVSALFAKGEDPLIFYKKIAEFADSHLNGEGIIFLELNQFYSHEIEQIYIRKDYKTQIIKDLQGNDRILKASRS